MSERENRDMLVVATKYAFLVWLLVAFSESTNGMTRYTTDYRSHELGKGKTVNYAGNHRKSLHLSIHASLKKLRTDYIDLLYVHWWVS